MYNSSVKGWIYKWRDGHKEKHHEDQRKYAKVYYEKNKQMIREKQRLKNLQVKEKKKEKVIIDLVSDDDE